MPPLIASVDPVPMILGIVVFAGLVIALVGWSAWLGIARGHRLLGVLPLLSLVLGLIGVTRGPTAIVAILTAIVLAFMPARPGSRWAIHRARIASGERDADFYTAPMIIGGVALLPVVGGLVLLAVNA